MDLRQLKYFAVAIETGSLKRAAEQLCISQPAVSKSIKELETELGTTLLVRGARGIEPNQQGSLLYSRAKAALADIDRAKTEILAYTNAETGTVTIASTAVPASHILPKAIAAFTEAHPDVKLHVVESAVESVVSKVQMGEVDLAVGPIGPAFETEGIGQKFLFETPVSILCRSGHPLLSVDKVSLADLLRRTWIASLPGTKPALNLELAFEAVNLPAPAHVVRTDSQLMTRSLLLASDFITFAPLQMYQNELNQGLLACLDIELEWPKSIPYGIIYRECGHLSPVIGSFWDALCKTCSELGPAK